MVVDRWLPGVGGMATDGPRDADAGAKHSLMCILKTNLHTPCPGGRHHEKKSNMTMLIASEALAPNSGRTFGRSLRNSDLRTVAFNEGEPGISND